MTTSRPPALAALALATALTVSACSSSNQTPAEDPTSASASPSPTAESSAPTVPSDWKTVALEDVAEISVPSDWTVKSTTDALDTLRAPKGELGFSPGSATVAVGNLAGGDQADELEWVAKHSMENDYAGYTNLKRLPDEVINGTTFYRLQFESGTFWFDAYGTVTPDAEYHIRIAWQFDKTISRKQSEAVWSPVMPTFSML
jgi:hypothetical protein